MILKVPCVSVINEYRKVKNHILISDEAYVNDAPKELRKAKIFLARRSFSRFSQAFDASR